MTLDRVYTLLDVIDEALQETNGAPTPAVRRWLQLNRRDVLNDNSMTIEDEGLDGLIRARRKTKPPATPDASMHNLCFDFGIEDLELDREISVPSDINDPLYSACDWRDIEDATVNDIDRHIALQEAQTAALIASTTNMKVFRQAVAKIVPDRTDIPVRELREIAKRQRGED